MVAHATMLAAALMILAPVVAVMHRKPSTCLARVMEHATERLLLLPTVVLLTAFDCLSPSDSASRHACMSCFAAQPPPPPCARTNHLGIDGTEAADPETPGDTAESRTTTATLTAVLTILAVLLSLASIVVSTLQCTAHTVQCESAAHVAGMPEHATNEVLVPPFLLLLIVLGNLWPRCSAIGRTCKSGGAAPPPARTNQLGVDGTALAKFQVQVLLDGRTTTLQVASAWTEDDVLTALEAKTCRSLAGSYLVFAGGKMLRSGKHRTTLADLGVGKDSRIEVRHRMLGGTNGASSSDAHAATKEQLRAAFKKFDTDGDGFIMKKELVAILTRVTGKQAMSRQEAEEVFAKADKNGDGRVDIEEFAAAWGAKDLHGGHSGASTLGVSPKGGGPAVAPQPPARRGVHAGVRVGWLKQWAKKVPADMSTLDVMLKYIKPETKEKFCRYVEIIAEQSPGDVGKAEAFVSHTWKAPFRDLVSALAAYMSDDQFVWVDVFAVLQWDQKDGLPAELVAEKKEDLDFASVVRACDYFVLVGTHVEAVAQWNGLSAGRGQALDEARQLSAFFRVWCLVEMEAALTAKKPVVMLVGAAAEGDEELRFVPNMEMLPNLLQLIDVEQAAASFDEDRVRILGDIERGVGFAAVNSLAKGAATCAFYCMEEPEVLRAALGNPAPLAALQGRERLGAALYAAAAGGLLAPLESLLGRRGEVEVDAKNSMVLGYTPLHIAAACGHLAAAEVLLRAGADVGATCDDDRTPLHLAATGGHVAAAEALLRAGADVNAEDEDGRKPLGFAQELKHEQVAELLRRHGGDATQSLRYP